MKNPGNETGSQRKTRQYCPDATLPSLANVWQFASISLKHCISDYSFQKVEEAAESYKNHQWL
jgi:hypothetical protein